MSAARKLTPSQVAAMAARRAAGRTYREISIEFGVAASTVNRSLKREHPEGYINIERKPCGTPAAYKRHIARREIACDPCVEANRLYERVRLGRV